MFSAVSHDDFVGNIWIICKVYANKLGIAFLRTIFYMRLNVYFLPIVLVNTLTHKLGVGMSLSPFTTRTIPPSIILKVSKRCSWISL